MSVLKCMGATRRVIRAAIKIALILLAGAALPVQACDLNGQSQLVLGQLLDQGTQPADELQQWKRWENLLLACQQQVKETGSVEALERLLFLGYVGYVTRGAATREYMASEVYPIYAKNPKRFLTALTNQPLLTESSCYYLGRYFTFEDQKELSQQAFLEANSGAFFKGLPEDQAKRCLQQF